MGKGNYCADSIDIEGTNLHMKTYKKSFAHVTDFQVTWAFHIFHYLLFNIAHGLQLEVNFYHTKKFFILQAHLSDL